jgi:signal peptidase I
MLPNTEVRHPERKKSRTLMTGFGVVLLFVLGFVVFFHTYFTTVVVSGKSMMPTLTNGKKVLVSNAYWLVGGIRHGDIVVIKTDVNGEFIIKRVYKKQGETVDVMNIPVTWKLVQGPYTVPQGTVYVLGDNREVSEDSRRLGPIDVNHIIGKVVAY